MEQLRDQAADLTLNPSSGASDAGKTATSIPTAASASSNSVSATASTAAAESKPSEASFETPKYTLVYRDSVDMQQFAAGCGRRSTRPQSLVLRIQLPRLTSAAGLDLDVGTRTLKLRSPAGYRLDAVLPLPVQDTAGNATFDRAARCLVVTLPVAPAAECVQDSGIDSDGAKNESDDDAYRTAGRECEKEGEGGSEEGEGGSEEGESVSTPAGATGVEDDAAVMAGESESGSESSEPSVTPSPTRLYSLPRFTFHQNTSHLFITIQEPNIVPDSPHVHLSERRLTITATSLGAGLSPLYYRLAVTLPAAVGEYSLRCGDDGVTLTVEKTEGDWTGCHVGCSEEEQTEQLIPSKVKGVGVGLGVCVGGGGGAT